MLKANIYSIEPLREPTREAVHDGISMVAAYMGENLLAKECRVKLPLNGQGHVNPDRVGLSKLDALTELHVMAVPLDAGKDEILGVAYMGSGVAFVDIKSRKSPHTIRSVTAHEVSHAFGHVMGSSKQADPSSKGHCTCEECIMRPSIVHGTMLAEPRKPEGRFRKLKSVFPEKTEMEDRPTKQHDFCIDCKHDIRMHGPDLANKLRVNRLLSKKVG